MQVYSAVQRAVGIQSSPLAQSGASSVEDGLAPAHVCRSARDDDEDQQCRAPQPDDVPVLVSGAGHDSLAMAELTQASVRLQVELRRKFVAVSPCLHCLGHAMVMQVIEAVTDQRI